MKLSKIMIIEDDPVIQGELQTLLNGNGYTTLGVRNFSAVTEQIQDEKPHLILLDIKLPGENGFALCSKIRTFSEVPIIFVTSCNTDMDELNSIMLGGDAFITDHICNKLTSANTFRYMMADKTISYDIAQELKSYFENSSLTDSLVTYNITMRTIEVNDNSAIIFIMQTGLTYSAIILFVTCFTILALQQLSDSGKYKYRFRVLRNMGVEEPHIRKLILKQLAVWFGVPIILALILSGAFLVFLFVGFHMQIAVYIGVQRLVQQLLIVLAILGVLLISYFISTWVLFNKSASA